MNPIQTPRLYYFETPRLYQQKHIFQPFQEIEPGPDSGPTFPAAAGAMVKME